MVETLFAFPLQQGAETDAQALSRPAAANTLTFKKSYDLGTDSFSAQ